MGVFVGASILIMFPRTLRSSFTPNKRSLESEIVASGVDGALTDSRSNCTPEAIKPLPTTDVSQISSPPLPRKSRHHRVVYRKHQRSLSGNVPFTSVPISVVGPSLSCGGTAQAAAPLYLSSRPHHQRSASVSSILLHAAIIAATASHAADEEDDEAVPSSDSESSSDGLRAVSLDESGTPSMCIPLVLSMYNERGCIETELKCYTLFRLLFLKLYFSFFYLRIILELDLFFGHEYPNGIPKFGFSAFNF